MYIEIRIRFIDTKLSRVGHCSSPKSCRESDPFYMFSYNDSFNRLKKWRSCTKVNERRRRRDAVCRRASKNIGRSADPVVRSSQRWPDEQDDRYLLSISFFHFFCPKNLLSLSRSLRPLRRGFIHARGIPSVYEFPKIAGLPGR